MVIDNTELTIESSKELSQNLESNIDGRMSVEATPENVVQLAINKIPRETYMSIDREGDNVFAYLNKLAEVDKYPGMEIDFDFLYFQEWTDEETGENWNWVEDNGTVNYDRGYFDTVGIQVNISYQGVEMQTKTGLTILDANEEPSVPDGTERLKITAHGTTTSGGLFVSEGERVTFTVSADEIDRDSVTTSSGLFVQHPDEKPVSTKWHEAFSVATSTPRVSRDGKTLTFDAKFRNVIASGRFDFYISGGLKMDKVDKQN